MGVVMSYQIKDILFNCNCVCFWGGRKGGVYNYLIKVKSRKIKLC